MDEFDHEKAKILVETRDKLVNETKAALKQQEEYMSAIIAKYMVIYCVIINCVTWLFQDIPY